MSVTRVSCLCAWKAAQSQWSLWADGAVDVERPALARHVGSDANVEYRPVAHKVLSGRQPLRVGSGLMAGEEAALVRPAPLGASELGLGRGVVGHGSSRGGVVGGVSPARWHGHGGGRHGVQKITPADAYRSTKLTPQIAHMVPSPVPVMNRGAEDDGLAALFVAARRYGGTIVPDRATGEGWQVPRFCRCVGTKSAL